MSVADSEEALALAFRRMPRMIVASFDLQTREDRFMLCLRLKADEHLRSVPVLLTSTDLDDDDLRRATDLRLLAIATSPEDCGKVLGAVEGILSVERPQRRKSDGRASRSDATNAYEPVLHRIRAEFVEMPGMTLTIEQVQRLCDIDRGFCLTVLDALVKDKFLCVNPDGTYARCAEGALLQRSIATRRRAS